MSSRPLPPVVLVTNGLGPEYAEVTDLPHYDQVNCMREECTGQQKMATNAEVGEFPKPTGNSPFYHTLEPATLDDDECSEVASDYMQPIASNRMAENSSEPAAATAST